MKIYGLQKMTLLDYPGRVACTVFTGGCNLRCPFCHNSALVTNLNANDSYESDEIIEFLRGRVGLLDGVCVTGGEPLLQIGISGFLRKIKQLGFKIKLDTNGTFPDKLADIVEEGLADYVAMDIKNCPEKYAQTVGIKDFDISGIVRSVDFLRNGKVEYEFRTTVVKEFHTVDDIKKAAKFIKGAKRYYLQNFVDSGNLIGSDMHPVSPETLKEMAKAANSFVYEVKTRGI